MPTRADLLLLGLVVACAGCGPGALTRETAADLLAKSMSTSSTYGTEVIPIVTPSGCLSVDAGVSMDGINPHTEPGILSPDDSSGAFRRLLELDLLEFELSEFPIDVATPPPGCEALWIPRQTGWPHTGGRAVKLIVWRTMLSDKALAAGLQVGQSFLYRRWRVVSVDRLEPNADGVTRVSYTWRWEPTYEGVHLGIPPSAPAAATAGFTRSSDRWQIVP